jgi:hypothetical protein
MFRCIKQINIKFNLEEEEKALIKNWPLKDAILLRNQKYPQGPSP